MRRESLIYLALCGLVIGISTYFQPSTQYLFIFLGIGIFIYNIGKLKWWKNVLNAVASMAIIVVAMVIVMTPWIIHTYNLQGSISSRAMRPAPWQGIYEGFGQFEDFSAIYTETAKELGYDLKDVKGGTPEYYEIVDASIPKIKNPAKAIYDDGLVYELIVREYGDMEYGSPEYQAILKDKVLTTIKEHPLWVIQNMVKRIPSSFSYVSELGIEYYPHKADGGIDWANYKAPSPSVITNLKEQPFITLQILTVGLLKVAFMIVPIILGLTAIYAFRDRWRLIVLLWVPMVYFATIHIPTFTSSYKSILPGCVGYIVLSAGVLYILFSKKEKINNAESIKT